MHDGDEKKRNREKEGHGGILFITEILVRDKKIPL
jgi:hypothetical protein